MSRIYAAGAAMGWTVDQVKATSMWEFWSAWNGYVKANTPKGGEKLTEADKDYIWERMQDMEMPAGPLTTQTYLWDGRGFVGQGRVSVLGSGFYGVLDLSNDAHQG